MHTSMEVLEAVATHQTAILQMVTIMEVQEVTHIHAIVLAVMDRQSVVSLTIVTIAA